MKARLALFPLFLLLLSLMSGMPVRADSYLDPAEWQNWPILPESISAELIEIYRVGLENGNDPERFSKIGDSNSITLNFLGCFDAYPAQYKLGNHGGLQMTIDQFKGSFGRLSYGAKNGAMAYDLDVYQRYDSVDCWPYESAMSCEYRLFTPSIAFIALGTHDALLSEKIYREHLHSMVEKTLERGIVPILATKMDNLEGDHRFNRITAEIAAEMGVPLWNLWRATHELPNGGLGEDGIHPSSDGFNICDFSDDELNQYGWSVRNFTALAALDRVWHLLNEQVCD